MKTNSIILKSASYIIVAAIFYMHLCSALCATGTSICCDKEEEEESDHHKKECCSHEKKSESKDNGCEDNGCQDLHFAFFGATGQFSQAKADISFHTFPSLIAVVNPSFILQPVGTDETIFDYNTFHPPPLNADIRILIQSFLI